jgi:hypothetical protein
VTLVEGSDRRHGAFMGEHLDRGEGRAASQPAVPLTTRGEASKQTVDMDEVHDFQGVG